MEKILIVKGSGRKQGFTNKIADEIEFIYKNEDVKIFDCYKERFKPCDGCNYCEKNGECAKGDLKEFYRDFESADKIFFLSPVYNGTFSAPIKALIDRFQIYYTGFYAKGKTQQIKKRREAYLIAASGRDGKAAFEYMQNQLKCAFTILNIEPKEMFLCSNTDTNSNYEEVVLSIKRSLLNG